MPFDQARLEAVATRLLDLYPAADRGQLLSVVTPQVIRRLVAEVTAGFQGDVGVVPRQFLRKLVNVLDMLDEGHAPEDVLVFERPDPSDLSPEEMQVIEGQRLEFDDDDLVPREDVW